MGGLGRDRPPVGNEAGFYGAIGFDLKPKIGFSNRQRERFYLLEEGFSSGQANPGAGKTTLSAQNYGHNLLNPHLLAGQPGPFRVAKRTAQVTTT